MEELWKRGVSPLHRDYVASHEPDCLVKGHKYVRSRNRDQPFERAKDLIVSSIIRNLE
jgi:hypothetical protein